jgi:tRNA nucleotidyltransferase (CCA-adding enzyme)
LRKPDRFLGLIDAAQCVRQGVDVQAWGRRLQAVRGIDAGAIAKACKGGPEQIKAALKEARLKALAASAPLA